MFECRRNKLMMQGLLGDVLEHPPAWMPLPTRETPEDHKARAKPPLRRAPQTWSREMK